MQEEKVRYYFVDGIRGVAIINMVIFHFLYDVYIVYEKSPTWYSLPAIHMNITVRQSRQSGVARATCPD